MHTLLRLQQWVEGLQGRKAYGLAFLLGALLTLAFAPFWLLPVISLSFPMLLWLLDAAHNKKQAFLLGWWFGFGHFFTGVYWVSIALTVDGSTFFWLIPFALTLLPGYLAIFPALAALVYFRFAALDPFRRIGVFALFWVAGEWLRSWLFSGFPWNLLGYIWGVTDATIQPASLFGVYGMSLWAVLLGASFVLLGKSRAPVFLLAFSVLLTGWGYARVENAADVPADAKVVRIVQASLKQDLKWDPEHMREGLRIHMQLSQSPSQLHKAPDYIVWPETAMPYQLHPGGYWNQKLGALIRENGALLTGVLRAKGERENWQVWNSLAVLNGTGGMVGSYDKYKLVPFGEFVPLRPVLSLLGLEKITHGATDFSRGEGAKLITLQDGAKIQPLICYETIFPGYHTGVRADWLLNITNDAWFGRSIGPYQHLHMARMRAVEQGTPLVRVANSGISTVFDAYGRNIIPITLGLGERGYQDITLPLPISVSEWDGQLKSMISIFFLILFVIYVFIPKILRF